MNAADIIRAYDSLTFTSSPKDIESIADRLDNRVTIWATGIGKSGLVAQKFVGTARSLGLFAHFVHPVDILHGDVGSWCQGDILILVSASGQTAELQAVQDEATFRGLHIVVITSDALSELARHADDVLISGSPQHDPGHIPSFSFSSACAVADAFAVALAGESASIDHPGGSIGRVLRTR